MTNTSTSTSRWAASWDGETYFSGDTEEDAVEAAARDLVSAKDTWGAVEVGTRRDITVLSNVQWKGDDPGAPVDWTRVHYVQVDITQDEYGEHVVTPTP